MNPISSTLALVSGQWFVENQQRRLLAFSATDFIFLLISQNAFCSNTRMDVLSTLKNTREFLFGAVLPTRTSDFIFFFGESLDARVPEVFHGGVKGPEYSVGKDRIVQKYLELFNYSVVSRIYPYVLNKPSRLGKTVLFYPEAMEEAISQVMAFVQRQVVRIGLVTGYATIVVSEIHTYVTEKVKKEFGDRDLTIRECSESLWHTLSPNPKGLIHTWMRRGPLFRPETYVTKPSREGCRLSTSDSVVIGLLSFMLRYGLQYKDFEGPCQAMPMLQYPYIVELIEIGHKLGPKI